MKTIYIDMDGVVADFERAARKIINVDPGELHKDSNNYWPRDQWEQLLAHPHLYRNLAKMPKADEMMALARRFRDELGWTLRMLTAIPRKNDIPFVFEDKIDWMREYYPDVPVFFGPYSEDKQNFCQFGDILVDDRQSNIYEWGVRGGIGILVTEHAYDEALNKLHTLFEETKRKHDEEISS